MDQQLKHVNWDSAKFCREKMKNSLSSSLQSSDNASSVYETEDDIIETGSSV